MGVVLHWAKCKELEASQEFLAARVAARLMGAHCAITALGPGVEGPFREFRLRYSNITGSALGLLMKEDETAPDWERAAEGLDVLLRRSP